MSKFIKSLLILVASFVVLLGSFQIQAVRGLILDSVMNKLEPDYKIKLIQPKGLWPFYFSADSIKVQTPDIHITLEQCSVVVNIKSLLTLQPKIDRIDVKQVQAVFLQATEANSTNFDIKALFKGFLAVMGQSYVRDVRIEKILINQMHSCLVSCFYQAVENGALCNFGLLDQPDLVQVKAHVKGDETFIEAILSNNNNRCLKNISDSLMIALPNVMQKRLKQLKCANVSAHIHHDNISKITGKIGVSAEFDDGIVQGDATLDQGHVFDVVITNSAPISHEFFGALKRLHAKGRFDQNALFLDDFSLAASEITALFQGNIKGDFSTLHAFESSQIKSLEGTIKIEGEILNGIFAQQHCTFALQGSQAQPLIKGQVQFIQGDISLPFIGQYFALHKPITFEWSQGLKFGIDALHGNTYTVESNQDLSDLKLLVTGNSDHSVFENGQINATIQNNTITLKGKIKPRGRDNAFLVDLRTNTDFAMWHGTAYLKIEDMPPLTNPFDFATVGQIDAHLDINNYDASKNTGKINIDLTSKYFRSPIFKTELTTLKGSVLGNGDVSLQQQTRMLAIGKQFLAQTAGCGIEGNIHKQTAFFIKAHSHKIGYLSSPLKIDIQGHRDWKDDSIVIEKFHAEHLKQSVIAQKIIRMSLNPFMIQDVIFDAGKGAITLNHVGQAKLGGAWSGTMAFKNISAGLLNWFLYKTIIVGTFNGSISLSGQGAQPDVTADIKASGLQWGKHHAFTPGVEETLSANLALKKTGELLTWNSQLKGKGMVDLQIQGRMQCPFQLQNPFNCQMRGYLDLSLISAFIATGDRLCGRLNCDLSVDGSMAHPVLKGHIKADNNYVELAEFGTIINHISANIVATGSRLMIQTLTATDTPLASKKSQTKQGHLAMNGYIDFRDITQPNVNMSLNVKNFLVVNSDSITGVASGNLNIKGEGIYARITGDADIEKISINLDELITDDDIPMIKIKDPKKRTYAKELQKDLALTTEKEILPLDILLKTHGNLQLSGSIVSESAWKGDVRALGPIHNPLLDGALNLKQGVLDFFGSPLKIDSAQVIFKKHRDNTPNLFMQAGKTVQDVELKVIIDTNQDIPISFKSSPAYDQDQILSLLLFGKLAGSVSAGQSIQLAAALSKLRGKKGFSLMDDVKKGIGLDTLEVTQQIAPENDLSEQKNGHYAVRIGKKITDATQIFVEQGAVQGSSKIAIDTQITDNLFFEATLAAPQKSDNAEFNKPSSSSAGLIWAKRY